jgi:SpoVK/Ycf46/Vps4 family AAA+-type ATPase
MARSDLLVSLVKAASAGDQTLLKKTVEAIIAEERSKQHHVLANNLAEVLQRNGGPSVNRMPQQGDDRFSNLLFEVLPTRKLEDLILPDVVRASCTDLIEEHHRFDLLRSYNLEPRNRILLQGPPGNGKTSLAEALAEGLMVPLIVVRYEGVIGTFLGETAVRLRRIFEYAATRKCVLFFDEFETLGKERGDVHETGEIKRVVSSLLLQIDALPSHVVVVTATNHSELLDRAVWRRFQLRLSLPPPSIGNLTEWFKKLQDRLEKPLGHSPESIAKKMKDASFAEAEDFAAMIARQYVLSLPDADLKSIVNQCLSQWVTRAKPTR